MSSYEWNSVIQLVRTKDPITVRPSQRWPNPFTQQA